MDHVQGSTLLTEHHSCQFIFNAYIIGAAVDSNTIAAGKKCEFCIQHVMAVMSAAVLCWCWVLSRTEAH